MRTALLGLTFLLAFVAKAWALDNALVGAWQHEHGTIEFYADGTFLADDGHTPVKGAWQAEDGKITVTMTPPGSSTAQSTTCDYKVEGDKMMITGGESCGTVSMDRIVAVVPVDPDQPLVGKWQHQDGTIEFHADGTLTLAGMQQQQINGWWTVQDGQITLTITLPNNTTQTTTCGYTIESNTLTISGESQTCGTTVFRRIS
jgi:uncharacterized protein (DUF2147 family)